MKKLNVFILLFFLLACPPLFAQPDIANMFEARSHTFNETTLPYRLFVPENYDSMQSYPLVLALHGSGERGSDNQHIQLWRLATSWADPINQANYPCFVVAPQCPAERSWVYDFNGPIGPELATVMDLLDSLSREFSIDENRLYVTGLSMGGFGTFDLIQRFPHRFAAAIPMSAGGDPAQAAKIANLPIWNFHGKIDDEVDVALSRNTIAAIEEAGQPAVYTHCKFENCTGLSEDRIDMYVRSHANLLYTEYENGGHIIWDESYDYPFLFPWVFSNYKRTKDGIQFTNFASHRILRGVEDITWEAIVTSGTVEIWFSPDAGETWQNVTETAPNDGSYQWDTTILEDVSFGELKIYLKNEDGFIYAVDKSGYFTIDNDATDGAPFVRILNDDFDKGEVFEQNEFSFELLVGDPEFSQLNVNYYYGTGPQPDFTLFKSEAIMPDTISQFKTIDLFLLPNSNTLVIKVEVADGNGLAADTTFHFEKNNERQFGQPAAQVAGNSTAIVTPIIIDANQLTGDLYRVTFDVEAFSEKVYNVTDVNTGETVVENATQMDGVTEGPYFDGIRLVIEDFDPPEIDFENSAWEMGTTELTVSIFLPTVNIGGVIYTGVAYAADYRISVFDHVVDTSSSAFGAPEIPMKFTVENITEDHKAEVVFFDTDSDHSISRNDVLYFVEADDQGDPQFIWAMTFTGDASDMPPQPGDIYNFYTLKPITDSDVFEFPGTITDIALTDGSALPQQLTLLQNYPNPFNPSTTIRYQLPRNEKVVLKIYNLLGQLVRTLVNEAQNSGEKSVIWNGLNDLGHSVSSGIYFFRLQAGREIETRSMLLLK